MANKPRHLVNVRLPHLFVKLLAGGVDLVLTIVASQELMHRLLIGIGQKLAVRVRTDAVDRMEAWLIQHGGRSCQDRLQSQA